MRLPGILILEHADNILYELATAVEVMTRKHALDRLLNLFASLGPTAYLLAHSPAQQSARAYNMIAGHIIGGGAAFERGHTRPDDAPSVFTTNQLTAIRVLASGLALFLAVTDELLLNASPPPAAATVLLITLGGFPLARGISSSA